MVRRSVFFPLNENEEVRPMTRSPSTCVSAFKISSAIPSEKYSWSLPGLMSAKGSTAIEGVDGVGWFLDGVVAGVEWSRTKKYQSEPGAAASRPMPTSTSARRVPRSQSALPSAGAVRSIAPAFTSNAHASTTATGKPSPSSTTTILRTESGRPSPCMIGSTTCKTANETTP